MRKIIVAACLMLIVGACTSIDCPVQNVVLTTYSLRKSDGVADTLKDSLYVFSFRRNGSDTLLLNAAIGVSSFTLPISYFNPEDTLYFLLRNDSLISLDTVWLKKDDIPHFESVDCNASFFHNITNVRTTHYGIDSLSINQPYVSYDLTTEHFYIYFKARN